MTNEELQEQLAGAQFAAAQHLKTVQQQAKIINGMDPRPIPASHRLLPVALHSAIEEALKRHCMMPNTAWQDVIAAWDRVNRDAGHAQNDELSKALRRAFNFGQTYWQQADSDYLSQQRKSNETADKFAAFVIETCAAFAAPAPSARMESVQKIKRAITLLRDGCGTRVDAEEALALLTAPERSGKTADDEPIGEVMAKPVNESGTLQWPRVVWKDGLFAVPPVGTKLYTHPAASSSAAPSELPPMPKPWARRSFDDCSRLLATQYMQAEIDDLRAYALRAQALIATPSVQAVAAGREQIFTYAGVTQNIEASRFGEAARRTMQKPGGDSIDTGLQLLLELQNMGYGIVAVPGLSTKPPALAGDTKAGSKHPVSCICDSCVNPLL